VPLLVDDEPDDPLLDEPAADVVESLLLVGVEELEPVPLLVDDEPDDPLLDEPAADVVESLLLVDGLVDKV